jgi:hypothetical protein
LLFYFHPVQAEAGGFFANHPLKTGRSGHTATLLRTGKLLIAGGDNDSGPLATAELYDSVTDT